jgi:C-terminal processing protease CtpA/Prc
MTKKILLSSIIFLSSVSILFSQKQDTLSRNHTNELVNNICKNLEEKYFNESKSLELSTLLKHKLSKNKFYNIPTDTLTKHLTKLLREKTNDIHFYVGRNKKKAKDNESNQKTANKNYNGGFVEVKILENNIGYIKWDMCIANDEAFEKIKSAFVFLKGCDYLIFDISKNPGGDGRSSGFINQHLYEDTKYQSLLIKKCRGESEWHQSEVPYNYSDGPKFFDIPIYIITSKNTGSAAEYFAFIGQQMNRATILGDTTAGAGNPVTMVTIDDFFIYIPICEIKTQEGKSIEAIGVVPNVFLTSKDWVNETLEYIMNTNKK